MGVVLWFAGLIGLIVAAAVASSRGRATPSEVVGRGVVAIAAAYAGLVVSAIWLWGGQDARDGRADRLREGATVAVTIEGVRVAIQDTPHVVSIGHGIDATVRMPGDGGDEAARVEIDARGHAVVRALGAEAAKNNRASVGTLGRDGHDAQGAAKPASVDTVEGGAHVSRASNRGEQVRLLVVTGELSRTSVARVCASEGPAAFDLPMQAAVA
ncbi:MAG: hypothetical protein H0V17_01970, partial [Deltaproteobacteria bacterium]|nr:hypothetical protein [Deltaproteobacteria bacterium]